MVLTGGTLFETMMSFKFVAIFGATSTHLRRQHFAIAIYEFEAFRHVLQCTSVQWMAEAKLAKMRPGMILLPVAALTRGTNDVTK